MKLIIEISEQIYKQSCVIADIDGSPMLKAIKNGTPLSESEDCVSRQAVLEILNDAYFLKLDDGAALQESVNQLPPVTPAEKVGRWVGIDEEPYEDYECNKCGYVVSTFTANIEPHTEYKYCPNCGAKMVEPQESEDKE